jgi:hypothetical protein
MRGALSAGRGLQTRLRAMRGALSAGRGLQTRLRAMTGARRFSVNFFGQLFHSLPHSLTPPLPHSFSLQCVRACITAPHREGRGGVRQEGRQVGGGRPSLPLLLKLKLKLKCKEHKRTGSRGVEEWGSGGVEEWRSGGVEAAEEEVSGSGSGMCA